MVSIKDSYNILSCLFIGQIGAVNCGAEYASCRFTGSIRQCRFSCKAEQYNQTVNHIRRQAALS